MTERGFPVTLYAGFLLSLVALLRPPVFELLEGWFGAVQTLPLRLSFGVGAVEAGSRARPDPGLERVPPGAIRSHAVAQAQSVLWQESSASLRATYEPVVVDVVARRGTVGRPFALELDAEVRDVVGDGVPAWGSSRLASFVTVGGCLVGFLDARPGEPLMVRMLHARGSDRLRRGLPFKPGAMPVVRRVAATVDVREAGGEVDVLRFLVEPASRIDPWPLRCATLEDPYRAARSFVGAPAVYTADVEQDPVNGFVPPGLRLGRLRAWGYPGADQEFVPIGLFVDPAVDAERLVRVVVWRRRGFGPAVATTGLASLEPLAAGEVRPVEFLRLPVARPQRQRWLALQPTEQLEGSWRASFPIGAAVVAGTRLVGTVRRSGPGYAVLAPFGEPGGRWLLAFQRRSGNGLGTPEVVPLRVASSSESRTVRLRQEGEGDTGAARHLRGPAEGLLFTAVGGRDLPAGLFVGATRLTPDGVFELPRERAVGHAPRVAVFKRSRFGGSR